MRDLHNKTGFTPVKSIEKYVKTKLNIQMAKGVINVEKIDSKNIRSQAIFKCISCGLKENADCNAAKNILEYKEWFKEQKTRWDTRHAESLKAFLEAPCFSHGVVHQ